MATAKARTASAEVQSLSGQLSETVLSRISDKLGIPPGRLSRMVEALEQVVQEKGDTDSIVDKYKADKSALIQILLEIQRERRWLPKDVLLSVCEKLGVPLSRAYRIATFYKAFSLVPQGRHLVTVCMGTACHIRGSPRLLDKVVKVVNINPGETSADQKFTLETVNCLGCCALGPVIVVDGEYHSNPSSNELEDLVAACD
jgi:NADH-quinone oxidoreductase subunit E